MAVADVRALDEGAWADSGVMALIEEATSVVDDLWRRALSDGTGQSALHFGEASQGLHRALIALGSARRHPDE